MYHFVAVQTNRQCFAPPFEHHGLPRLCSGQVFQPFDLMQFDSTHFFSTQLTDALFDAVPQFI